MGPFFRLFHQIYGPFCQRELAEMPEDGCRLLCMEWDPTKDELMRRRDDGTPTGLTNLYIISFTLDPVTLRWRFSAMVVCAAMPTWVEPLLDFFNTLFARVFADGLVPLKNSFDNVISARSTSPLRYSGYMQHVSLPGRTSVSMGTS